MQNIQTIRDHQKAFLEKVKARQEKEHYTIEGIEIVVNPGVFPPATDTKLLASSVHVKKGDRILDVTTGSGVIPVVAGLQGATGVGVDINPAAVENARDNVSKYNVHMDIVESDLFDRIPSEKSDYIFANGPFFEGDIHDPLDYACYGAKSFIGRLFTGLKDRLKPSGKLFIVFYQWSDLDYVTQVASRSELSMVLKEAKKSDDGERTYLLYEVTFKQ